jgi:hypothetical protein
MGIALILATTFINPECWWARYAPQIALLPAFMLIPGFRSASSGLRIAAWAICAALLLNNAICAGAAAGASFLRSRKINRTFAAIAQKGGRGEYWAYRAPGELVHYEQFSGLKGITICGELDPPNVPLPQNGFPVTVNARNATEVTLIKGQCSSPPPH